MLIEQVKKLDPKGRLVYWIRERESIRLKKLQGLPKPWTDDKILSSFRFCCPRRMDDKVSDWLLLNWYEKYHGHKSMAVACVLARHFNQITTLRAIGFPDFTMSASNWKEYTKHAKKIIDGIKAKDHGPTIFNSAYIIRADGKFPNKVDMVFDETVKQFVTSPAPYLINADRMEDAVNLLMGYRNIGSFMAGQIAADLRWATKGEFVDKDKWAAMGPGSARGMNRLHGRDVKAKLKQDQFLEELKEFVVFAKKALPKALTSRLEMIDWQNCFCEFDKYCRVLLGEGRPKQLYDGGSL